ncbi:MAG TPA: HNH endonuclease signature motif containing protein [Nocardioides sp.]|uniref:HNH endonuclease signature motif containing protein n=1 Tax=uncultured Nocardioides sp. TaxID=198441 RepID=UPI0026166530|nr:HNH endonuclease signature motif containing protein [uncultured Nocardioides sp.]HRD59804.1 HNH endonuclease signature motif containing protein [Nocardioides sp.]HRI94213.1 HNH endonuclease signature motif containing protein [Nocardioides sp.]HRI94218.1 HNH endonuclease signature motif containing protein [Nocardioides sp.]HRK45119.1 HNH endonuclease signature motif containing protein [Nocardioides sp.]
MTSLPQDPAEDSAESAAVTPTQLIGQVRELRAVVDAAEAQLFRLAVAWVDAHPNPEESVVEDPESSWHGLPPMRWDAGSAFAAANHMSTAAGEAYLRDAQFARYRLPKLFARTASGRVPVWRARRVVKALLGQPDDVCDYVDTEVAHRAETVGPVILDRLVDEAMLRLHAEERELEQIEALDARFVRFDQLSINYNGIADLHARADLADVAAFDDAVAEVAAALGREGCPESLDVRRSMALGVLADPARALALLTDAPTPGPKRRIFLTYNLTDGALLGLDPVGFDIDGRALLDQAVRQWCARDDVRITVQPLLRVGACKADAQSHEGTAADDYRPSAADELEVQLRDRTCAHPYCTRPARRCDCDHVVPFARGGPTCPCNLAPLCRRHHRLKTFAGWSYLVLQPGLYLWTDPHGQQSLRGRDGTRDLTAESALSAG